MYCLMLLELKNYKFRGKILALVHYFGKTFGFCRPLRCTKECANASFRLGIKTFEKNSKLRLYFEIRIMTVQNISYKKPCWRKNFRNFSGENVSHDHFFDEKNFLVPQIDSKIEAFQKLF